MARIRKPSFMGKRVIHAKGLQSQKQIQERYHLRLVMQNTQYALLIASLKEGISPATIASHFATNGWITVNERVFAQAIRAFRLAHPEALVHGDDPENRDLNRIVPPNVPGIDEYAALQQLLRLQQLRLGIEVTNEKAMNKLFQTTVKDIEATNKIIETMAKMKGKIKDGGASIVQEAQVTEDLQRIKKDQLSRDRLHTMVGQLVQKA